MAGEEIKPRADRGKTNLGRLLAAPGGKDFLLRCAERDKAQARTAVAQPVEDGVRCRACRIEAVGRRVGIGDMQSRHPCFERGGGTGECRV